jgi:hypothetical protein
MSLGNVSRAKTNQHYYHEALMYLQSASELQDYSLPEHLQQSGITILPPQAITDTVSYLDEYGPLDKLV